jgi:3-hydroxybutyrate dehydrogenase
MNVAIAQRNIITARVLDGKVSLVTGSTSGIGLGIARALAASGSAIVLNGFGEADQIARNRTELRDQFGVRVEY